MERSSIRMNHSHLDRSFKTISLPLGTGEFRVKGIGHKDRKVAVLHQKKVNLGVSEKDYYLLDPIFRIKSKLSMAVDGVRESDWVAFNRLKENEVEGLNHYRIRGISGKGTSSSWVYSNIKTSKNEEVLFELIHDLLTVLEMTQDDELEYLFDSIVDDLFISRYQDHGTHLDRQYDFLERPMLKIEEVKAILSKRIKESFTERVTSSFNYFSELVRTYKIIDRLEQENKDFLALILESFLDDQLDNIIQKADYEAILQNDEETHVLIQDLYNIDVKCSLIQSLYNIDLEELFVINMTDVVKLITEPEVFEEMSYRSKEDYCNLFTMIVEDIYLPLFSLSEMTAMAEIDLADDVEVDKDDHLVEFDLIEEDKIQKNLLLKDILILFLDEKDVANKYFAIDLLDRLMTPVLEKKLSIWIDYKPVEFVEYIASVIEKTTVRYRSLHKDFNKNKSFEVEEVFWLKDKSNMERIYDKISFYMNEALNIIDTYLEDKNKELFVVSLFSDEIANQMKEEKGITDSVAPLFSSALETKHTISSVSRKMMTMILYKEELSCKDSFLSKGSRSFINVGISSEIGQIYKPNLKEVITHRVNKSVNDFLGCVVASGQYDTYILQAKDDVRYILGDFGGRDALGRFILGKSTLRSSM